MSVESLDFFPEPLETYVGVVFGIIATIITIIKIKDHRNHKKKKKYQKSTSKK
ncbi:MAG: hypothetical protein ACPKPY_03145 [Nitrososphaeraceae archaeon]